LVDVTAIISALIPTFTQISGNIKVAEEFVD